MDASCCLQESIHLLKLIQLSMCPVSWVHIITAPYLIYFHGRVPDPVFEDSEHLDIKEAGHDREQAQCEEDDY